MDFVRDVYIFSELRCMHFWQATRRRKVRNKRITLCLMVNAESSTQLVQFKTHFRRDTIRLGLDTLLTFEDPIVLIQTSSFEDLTRMFLFFCQCHCNVQFNQQNVSCSVVNTFFSKGPIDTVILKH